MHVKPLGRVWSLQVAVAVIALAVCAGCTSNAENGSGPPIIGAPASDVVGKPANLAFTMSDFRGQKVSLEDFRGKTLIVNVWATWCAPCRQEIPWFIEFSEKYKSRGLAVVGVSYDDAPADIEAFVKDLKVPYPMLVGLCRDDFFKAFDAESVYPVTWIVKPDGTVQAKAVGVKPREWFVQQIEAAL
jgi:cytochrome c biogenesis protein CcmG/thiol:disulfide interchange protein DsbE